jgi:hypothetical protein
MSFAKPLSLVLLGGFALCTVALANGSNAAKPDEDVPPIELEKLNKNYLMFLKDQCRNNNIPEGTPQFTQCMKDIAEANRDVRLIRPERPVKKAEKPAEKTLVSEKNDLASCDAMTNAPTLGKKILGSVIVEGPNSENKMELLASTARLSDSQKPDIKAFAKINYECYQRVQSGIKDVDLANAVGTYMTTMDQVYADLYGGNTTIGQANAAKLAALQSRDTLIARLHNERGCK